MMSSREHTMTDEQRATLKLLINSQERAALKNGITPPDGCVEISHAEAIDIPAIFMPRILKRSAHRRETDARKHKYKPQAEKIWTRNLMEQWREWHHVVGVPAIEEYHCEYIVSVHHPMMVPDLGKAVSMGLPRLDALCRHVDGSYSIVESKVKKEAHALLGGVGQLLYYKTMIETLQGRNYRISNLILASPWLPPFLSQTINEHRLPVRLLKFTDDKIIGGIPRHLLPTDHPLQI